MSRRRKKQQGGYLDGPLHEDGGIPAIISGGEEVELEGGEYIINAQTVDALGVPFLDKLNSTATTYHDGGFEQGQLPGPSQYELGGRIPPGFGPEWQRRHGERSHRRAGPRIRRGRGYGGTGDNSGQGAGRRMGGQITRKRRFHGGGGLDYGEPGEGKYKSSDGTGTSDHDHPHYVFCGEGGGNPPGCINRSDTYQDMNGQLRLRFPRPIPRPAPGTGMIPPSDPGLMGQGTGREDWNDGSGWTGRGRMKRRHPGTRRASQWTRTPRRTDFNKGGTIRHFQHGGYHCGPGEMCHGGRMNEYGYGGMMSNSCPAGMHMMPDGSCMQGAYHGANYSHGGGVHTGSPDSCQDGYGNNVPC